jgi:alpha-tubulin suppressor-like RCC1 family protein
MGDSTIVNKSSPVQIGTDSWTAVSAGASHSAAIRSDNVLFSWGLNSSGQVGDGTTINKISPRIVNLPDVNTLSLFFPGASQISVAAELFAVGTGQFTYEAWVYRTVSAFQTLFTDVAATPVCLQIFFNTANTAELWISASQLTGNFGSVPLNQWHHIILQRDGSNNLQAYVNGVRGYNAVRTDNVSNSGIRIGGRGGDYLTGYISNFRYVTGSALYSGTPITVPTSPLTAVTNTQFLAAQSKIYIDNSLNNSYITVDNLISISTVNPFNSNTEPSKYNSVSAGSAHTMAITTTGNLQAWGSGADSRLGYVAEQQWSQISHGVSHTVAIRNDGILFAWGLNNAGQLGDGTTVNKSSPIQIGSSSWTAVAAGASYTMALRSGGTLFTWGLNSSGQLGDGTTINKSVVTQIGSASWIAISTEGSHSTGLSDANILYAWGLNSSGQLGDSTTVNKSSPVQIGSSSWTAISAGTTHTAAIRSGGTLFTWGRGIEGQLGHLTQIYSWTQISSGNTHTLAIRNDGLLFAWGLGTSGQLGDGTAVTKSSPVQIGSSSWTAVAAGTNYSMAIRTGGTLFTWGLGTTGQLGDSTLTSKSSPVQIGSSSWTAVSSDLSHGVALRSDGYLYTWGLGSSYQIGDATSTNRSSPTLLGMNTTANISAYFSGAAGNYVTGTYKIIDTAATTFTVDGWVYLIDAATDRYIIGEMSATAASGNLVFYINTSRQLICYWTEPTGRTCTSTATFTLGTWTYFAVVVNNKSISMYIGSTTASGLTGTTTMNFRSANQTLTVGQYNNGSNFYGYLSNLRVSTVARSVASLPTSAFTQDSSTTLLLFRNPYFVDNGSNQRLTVTGAVLTTESLPFAGTTTAQTFSKISAGGSHTMAITTDNKIWAVGRGDEGQLGYVSEILSWTQVASGYHHNLAIRSDGMLFTWGENAYGALGDQTATNKSSPVQIGSSSWTAVAAGIYHSLAVRSGGTLFAWGRGHTGQLGNGLFTNQSSPVQIGTNSWTAINASYNFSLGITSDNVLYSWGVNDRGYLGNNDPGQGYRPVPAPVSLNSTTIASVRFYQAHGSYLRISQSPNFDFGTNPFTIEGWFYTNNYSYYTGWVNFFGIGGSGGNTNKLNLYDDAGNGLIDLDINGTVIFSTSDVKTTLTDQWAHIAVVREGTGTNQTKIYVNGTQRGQGTVAQSLLFKGCNFIIGHNGELYSNPLNGYVSNFRVVNGTAVYTGNFTPSTSALTSITNTVLLTCQSETLRDNGPSDLSVETVQHAHVDIATPFAGSITSRNYNKVESGDNHVLAIDTSGSLYSWGYGFYGQLGLAANATTQYSWRSVSSGAGHTLAIRSDYKLFAWGRSTEGQIGDGRAQNHRSSPVQIGTNSWIAVATGWHHSVGIKADNTLWTWGYNNYGQLGTRQLTNYSTPQQIGLERPVSVSWTQIAAGAYHTAAITSTNRLYTWGLNDNGQLGDRTQNMRTIPVPIGMNTTSNASVYFDGTSYLITSTFYITDWPSDVNLSSSSVDFQIEAWIYVTEPDGYRGIISLRNAGEADGWCLLLYPDDTVYLSANIIGVGWSTWQLSTTPVLSSVWTHIALVKTANDYYKLYIDGLNVGSLNYTGGLAFFDRSAVHYLSIGTSALGFGVENYFRGYISSVRINKGGGIYTANFTPSTSTLTAGTYTKFLACQSEKLVDVVTNLPLYSDSTPRPIISDFAPYTATASFQGFANVAAGHSHTAAIGTDNKLYSWGRPTEGQTGILANAPPQFIGLDGAEDPRWAILAAGVNYAYGIRTDGLLYAWGLNDFGQLGDGTTVNKSSPVQVGTDSWVAVSAGNTGSAIAIRTDGKLFAWGRGNVGGGVGALVSETHSWKSVSAGDGLVVAIRNDGLLFTWGSTAFTTAGVSDPKVTYSPNQIGYKTWSMASASASHIVALDSNGQMYAWGYNTFGQIGDGTTVAKSYPTPIGGESWTWVSAGFANSAAIRSDGKLFTWGRNSSGLLGDGTTVDKFSPVQIGTSNWTMVEMGLFMAAAIRSDGILFGWGNAGLVGDNTNIAKSSPTQIAGAVANNSWSTITCGRTTTLGITNGELYAWGNGTTLGLNSTVSRLSPVQVGSFTDWHDVKIYQYTAHGLRTNGALYSWGQGTSGELGDNTMVAKSSPVQIGADGDWWTTGYKTTLGGGNSHASAIKADGTLWHWGINSAGNYGRVNGTSGNVSSPVVMGGQSHGTGTRTKYQPFQILSTSSWSVVAAGTSHTMAIRSDGKLFTWGTNASGQLGDGTTVNKSSPVQIGSDSWVMVAAGGDHSLAIKAGVSPNPLWYGTLWSWGKNDVGQLGIGLTGTANNRSSPVQIGTSVWAAISAGQSHTVGIKDSLSVWSWGLNASGQLGDSTTTNRNSPVIAGLLETVAQVETGYSHTVALTTTGNFYTWGLGASGQVWSGSTSNVNAPTSRKNGIGYGRDSFAPIMGGTDASNYLGDRVQIAAGQHNTYAIDFSGQYIWAGGLGSSGQLGDSTTIAKSSPVAVATLWLSKTSPRLVGNSSWTAVAAGKTHTAAIRTDGLLFAWGGNDYGQLGLSDTVTRNSPTQLGSSSWTAVAAGEFMTVAIRSGGTLFTWGRGTEGQIGDGSATTRSSPVQVGSASWIAITAGEGEYYAAGIAADNYLYTWGYNNLGQLGLINTTNYSSPVQVGGQFDTEDKYVPTKVGNSSWTAVAAGQYHSLAIRSGGSLFAWGYNNVGQVGDGTNTDRSSPVQIGSSSWAAISAGESHSVAIASDGKLFAWGRASEGQLGNLSLTAISSPVQVGTSASWTVITGGRYHTAGINSNNISIWGWNNYGQIGDNTTVNKSSPVLLGGTAFPYTQSIPVQINSSSWTVVSAGGTHTAAIRSDSTLWTWGFNSSGQLGDGTTIVRSSPVQIGSSSWTAIVAGGSHTLGISANLVYAWGLGTSGQLGDGTAVSKSSPVQIGSSSWTIISAGDTQSIAIRTDGTLFTWGLNSSGQLGDATAVNRSSPVVIGGNADFYSRSSPIQVNSQSWAAVASGGAHTLAILNGGTLFTWGLGTSGQLGDGTAVTKGSPVQIGSSSWTAVAAGSTHSLAINSTNILYAWGLGTSGQLGDGTAVSKSSPVQIGSGSWTLITAGSTASLAISANNMLLAWGLNSVGELGDSTTINKSSPVLLGINSLDNRSLPVPIGTGTSWSVASAGDGHSAAINNTGTLYAWGLNNTGQLGDSTTVTRTSPLQLGSSSWTAVAAGTSYTMAIRSGGTLFTWGLASSGELGDSTTVAKSSPVQIGSQSWIAISTDSNYGGAITSSNLLYIWGTNSSGQIGDGTTIAKSSPQLVGDNAIVGAQSSPVQIGSSSWTAVSAGGFHTMAIRSGGTLFTWGLNASGQIGDNTTVNKSSPIQIGTNSWSVVAAGLSNSAAIRSDNRLFMWGFNATGQLGDGTTVNKSSPLIIGGAAYGLENLSWVSVSIGKDHAAAVTTDLGGAFIWGLNSSGQLGDATTVNKSVPVVVIQSGITATQSSPVQIGSNSWSAIAAGPTHTMAINSAGGLFTWGLNSSGQIGDNATSIRYTPFRIGNSTWANVSTGDAFSVAIGSTAGVYVWGLGTSGQLGDGTATSKSLPVLVLTGDTINRSSPVQIGASSWTAVSAGAAHTLAIRADSLLWAWGLNNVGQVGDGTATTRSQPQQIGFSSWTAVSAGASHSVALDITNRMYAWGLGTSGQLGDSTATSKSSPVAIGSSSWTAVSAGGAHTVAIRSGGTLFTWGLAASGQLGDSTTVNKSSPVQIGSSSWTAIAAGDSHTVAISGDSALYAWGLNSTYQVGDGTTVNKSSPVLISSANNSVSWTAITAGTGHSMGISANNHIWTWGTDNVGQLGDIS